LIGHTSIGLADGVFRYFVEIQDNNNFGAAPILAPECETSPQVGVTLL